MARPTSLSAIASSEPKAAKVQDGVSPKELSQQIEVLERRLARSQKTRRRLEDSRERDGQFLRNVIANLQKAEVKLIEQNNDLSALMDEDRTREP